MNYCVDASDSIKSVMNYKIHLKAEAGFLFWKKKKKVQVVKLSNQRYFFNFHNVVKFDINEYNTFKFDLKDRLIFPNQKLSQKALV